MTTMAGGRTRVVEIDNCHMCPSFSYGPRTCGEMGDKYCPDSKTSIPEWCPLLTPEEYVEEEQSRQINR